MLISWIINQLDELLEEVPFDIVSSMWFMHGAPPHFSRITRQNKRFSNKWIGRAGLIAWLFTRFKSIRFLFLGPLENNCLFNTHCQCWNTSWTNTTRLPIKSTHTWNFWKFEKFFDTIASLHTDRRWPFRILPMKVSNYTLLENKNDYNSETR